MLRATSRNVCGGASPDPADWWYSLTLTGPRTTRTVTAPADAVCAIRYATETHAPARGVAPLAWASLTGTLAGHLERALGHEAGGAVANLIALPEGHNSPDELAEAIRVAKGRTLLPETTAGGYGDRLATAPRRDWEPSRLGADPPMALVTLRQQVESTVLACFGVPAPLGPAGVTDGTAAREAARFWTLTVQPLGDLIAEELSRVLDRPVSLDFGRPSGMADLAARARAVGALAKVGVDVPDAMALSGWGD